MIPVGGVGIPLVGAGWIGGGCGGFGARVAFSIGDGGGAFDGKVVGIAAAGVAGGLESLWK